MFWVGSSATIVEHDISVLVEAQLAVLRVLLDGIERLARRTLELGARVSWNLAHHIVDLSLCAVTDSVQRHIMPRADLSQCAVGLLVVEVETVLEGVRRATVLCDDSLNMEVLARQLGVHQLESLSVSRALLA